MRAEVKTDNGPKSLRPAISVALPTRDRWSLARRALSSVLKQRDVDLEVLVVDDGSAVAEHDSEEFRDDRVRIIRCPESRGVAAARNVALAEASAEWVAFLDDDDLWAPEKLSRQLAVAQITGAGFVWTTQVVVDATLRPVELWSAPAGAGIGSRLSTHNAIGGPSSVIARTDLVKAAGGFDEHLAILADWDLWVGLNEIAQGAACDEVLTAYVLHDKNMHLTELGGALAERRYMLNKRGPATAPRDDSRYWEWVAGSYRRDNRRVSAARVYASMFRRFHHPRDLARAVGVLLGEPAMRLGARGETGAPVEVELPWLDAIRAQVRGEPDAPGAPALPEASGCGAAP
jgi:glycosyltransferase involved in cell wall biosynthesis